MKISIAATLLILAAGAGLGWHDRQQLAALRTTQNLLATQAAKLGVSPDPAQNPTRSTKRERPSRPAAAKLSTAGLIGLTKEMERLNTAGGANYDAINALQLRIFDSLSALDPAGIKALLAEITTNPDLGKWPRMMLGNCCTTVFANDHPQAALEIFTSSPELFTEGDRGRSLVLTALVCLAKNDLTAALDWMRKNPQHFVDDAKGEIISAVAKQDALLAFRLVTELDFKISAYAVGQILNSLKSLEEKSAALAGLREYLATIRDEKVRDQLAASSISGLAGAIGKESFESATRWIAGENLTPQELGQFAKVLHVSTSNGETGRWIEWLHQSLPAKQADRQIEDLIHRWTSTDYQAAAQWAMTQPPGKDRDQTLQQIHQNWPKQDAAGKQAFAIRHGIN